MRQRFTELIDGFENGLARALHKGSHAAREFRGGGNSHLMALRRWLEIFQGDRVSALRSMRLRCAEPQPENAETLADYFSAFTFADRVTVAREQFFAVRREHGDGDVDTSLIHQHPRVLAGLQSKGILVRLPFREFPFGRLARLQGRRCAGCRSVDLSKEPCRQASGGQKCEGKRAEQARDTARFQSCCEFSGPVIGGALHSPPSPRQQANSSVKDYIASPIRLRALVIQPPPFLVTFLRDSAVPSGAAKSRSRTCPNANTTKTEHSSNGAPSPYVKTSHAARKAKRHHTPVPLGSPSPLPPPGCESFEGGLGI